MHMCSLEALCPLSVPHPPCGAVPLVTLCPLLQWPSRESRAGWRGNWRERGASSLKTMWRCCSPRWKYTWTSYHLPGKSVWKCMLLNSEIHSRALFIQNPWIHSSKWQYCMLLLVDYSQYIHDILYLFWQEGRLMMHVQAWFYVWIYFGQIFTWTLAIQKRVCMCNVLLCTNML